MSNNQQILDQMKNEIAQELGIELGAEQTSKLNGAVGGQMTRRLIQIAEETLKNKNNIQ